MTVYELLYLPFPFLYIYELPEAHNFRHFGCKIMQFLTKSAHLTRTDEAESYNYK